jgi:hypothetical protein
MEINYITMIDNLALILIYFLRHFQLVLTLCEPRSGQSSTTFNIYKLSLSEASHGLL